MLLILALIIRVKRPAKIDEIRKAAQLFLLFLKTAVQLKYLKFTVYVCCVLLRFLFIILMQIFLCSGEHQLDSVQLVYFTCTRIIINGNDVCFRMLATNFLDNTFTYDVIWQAAKWLDADDVWFPAETIGEAIFARSRISAAGVK